MKLEYGRYHFIDFGIGWIITIKVVGGTNQTY